jgi:hypothetical protein
VGTSKNFLLLVLSREKIAVSTAIFSLRIENRKLKVFRASLMGNFVPTKLPPPGSTRIIASGNYAPRKLPVAISWPGSELPLAAGGDKDAFFCGGPQKNMVAHHAIVPQLRPQG